MKDIPPHILVWYREFLQKRHEDAATYSGLTPQEGLKRLARKHRCGLSEVMCIVDFQASAWSQRHEDILPAEETPYSRSFLAWPTISGRLN